jgi:hypothetical protein
MVQAIHSEEYVEMPTPSSEIPACLHATRATAENPHRSVTSPRSANRVRASKGTKWKMLDRRESPDPQFYPLVDRPSAFV